MKAENISPPSQAKSPAASTQAASPQATSTQAASTQAAVAERQWDVVVIGAGPAGGVSALLLAQQGKKVLLVDKAAFPRNKVCGSCISAKTMRYLGQAGLADLPAELNAAKISRFQLSTIGGTIKINLPLGFALSREALDNGIVQRAITAGAVFLPSTSAAVGPCQAGNEGLREVGLATASGDVKVYASCVLVADGLNGRALADLHEPENMLLATEVATASRIGAGTIVAPSAALDRHYQSGSIYMALDRGGYVGLVRLEGGRLDLAAAFDPVFTREMGSPQSAAKEILQRVGLPYLPDFDQGHWAGTAPLTRQRRALAAKRLFVIGDAACYGEPFTGEGMAWACAGALLVVPLAMQACQRWDDSMTSQWQTEHKKLIGNKQIISRRLGRLLRNEKFARVALGGVLKHLPVLAKPIVDRVCR